MTAYPIPTEALDDRFGVLGTPGSGKTYFVLGAMAQLLRSGARAVGIDPLGVMWGLRLDKDGKTPSPFNVVIFGGKHADLPLTEHAGALIGETVATMAESCIIDLSELPTKAAERRFMVAFMEAIYRATDPDKVEPYHLIVDEADRFAPQKPPKGDEILLNRMEEIVRRGRVRGFITWLVTQRPAVLNKNVLSMVDSMVVMKLVSATDRDQIRDWVDTHANPDDWRAMRAAFPTLARGSGVLWMPSRGRIETVAFPENLTFDSSASPKRGQRRVTKHLKALDLGALKERLAGIEEEVKANDPRTLKAEIARLKAELAKAPAIHPDAIASAEERGYQRREAEIEALTALAYRNGQVDMRARVSDLVDALDVPDEPAFPDSLKTQAAARAKPTIRQADREKSAAVASVNKPPPPPPPRPKASPATGEVPPGCAKPLAALAAVYPSGLTEAQWSTAAGYKRSGGTWGTYKSRLRGTGLIEQREGRWFATKDGASAAGDVELPPPPGPDLVRWWAAKLPGTTKLAEALIAAWPRDLDRDELAAAVAMSPAGGSFGTYLSRLAGPGLIERSGRTIRLSSDAMGPAA